MSAAAGHFWLSNFYKKPSSFHLPILSKEFSLSPAFICLNTMLFSTIVVSALASTALAQTQKSECGEVFDTCRDIQETYKTETCGPLQARNMTQFEECLCIQAANLDICYDQCLTVPQQIRERPSITNAATTLCAKMNINPKALPRGSWITFGGPTTSSAAARPTATSAIGPSVNNNSTTNTTGPGKKSSADKQVVVSLGAFIALMLTL